MSEIKYDDDIIKSDEGLIFNPYNPLNIEITLNDVQSILIKYGLPPIVNNLSLYKRAFVHKSYTKRPQIENLSQNITIVEKPDDCLSLKTKSNERLEFLGDGVLELVTKFSLYRRFPKENEGFMTEKKITIVKNKSIGKIALDMRLNKWLILSKHAEEKNIRSNVQKLGCLFEAFIGALFLDFNKIDIKDEAGWFKNIFEVGPGFQMAQKFVENIFTQHIDWISVIKNNDNYKGGLQVIIQKEFKVTPDYLEIEHDLEFGYKVGVYLCLGQHIYNLKHKDAISIHKISTFKEIHDYLNNNDGKIFLFMGEGQHKIKREAQQIACNEAIKLIKLNNKVIEEIIENENEL